MKAVIIRTEPGVNELVHTDPQVRTRLTSGRSIDFQWEVGPGVDRFGREVIEVAVLSCYSHHPERKVYTASLRREQLSEDRMVRSTMIHLGVAPAFSNRKAAARYSKKDLIAFADETLTLLRLAADDSPEIGAIFGVEPTTIVDVDEQRPGESNLDWLQRLVGGSIEPIELDAERMEGYVNEEGKLLGLDPNPVAFQFRAHKLSGEFMLRDGEYVAGPLVIVGPLDEDGETTGVTDEVVEEVRAFVANPVDTDRLAKETEAYVNA